MAGSRNGFERPAGTRHQIAIAQHSVRPITSVGAGIERIDLAGKESPGGLMLCAPHDGRARHRAQCLDAVGVVTMGMGDDDMRDRLARGRGQ